METNFKSVMDILHFFRHPDKLRLYLTTVVYSVLMTFLMMYESALLGSIYPKNGLVLWLYIDATGRIVIGHLDVLQALAELDVFALQSRISIRRWLTSSRSKASGLYGLPYHSIICWCSGCLESAMTSIKSR